MHCTLNTISHSFIAGPKSICDQANYSNVSDSMFSGYSQKDIYKLIHKMI